MPNDTEIVFGELPAAAPQQRTYGKWAAIAAALRERPGEWAKVDTKPTSANASTLVSHIRRGALSGLPIGEFEAVRRGFDVWARYIGGAKIGEFEAVRRGFDVWARHIGGAK